MQELVWSYGDKPQRSLRRRSVEQSQIIKDNGISVEERKTSNHVTANRCLLENEDQLSLKHIEDEWTKSNKREESYNKMSEREMIGQRGYNPFNPTNNYFDNLLEHEKYVKNN